MDFDDEAGGDNIWARQSPDVEKTLNSDSNKRSSQLDNDDWDAGSEHAGDLDTLDFANKLDLAQPPRTEHGFDDFEDTPEQQPEAGPSSPRVIAPPTAPAAGSFDDFDDDDGFGDFGGDKAGAEDDDDFGAFDEADADADFGDSFAAPPSAPEAGPSSSGPSTSTETGDTPGGEPLTGEFIDFAKLGTDPEVVGPLIENLFDGIWPGWREQVSEELPEVEGDEIPQGKGIDAILWNQELKEAWHDLVEKEPEYEPFDWKRSSIRRNMLLAQGKPINLDDMAPPSKPMPNLVLPSIHKTPASPTLQAKPAAAHSIARSSSPSPSGPSAPSIPPLDFARANELANAKEDEMSFRTVGELEMMRKELQEIAVQASNHLAILLEKKENLTGQSETYNAMIQDLAKEAQKLRSPNNASSSTNRKASLKRSNSSSSTPRLSSSGSGAPAASAAPASTGRTGFFGGGGGSKPNSRPASPAPALGLKTSVGRSAAGQAPSPAREVRRSSLW